MSRTAQDVRTALEAIGTVTDGANEGCMFLEVTNPSTGLYVTIDERNLLDLDDTNFTAWLATLSSHLGVS